VRPDYDPIPNLSPAEAQAVRAMNLEKVWRRCNRCQRQFLTDRCHHTCPRCKKHDNDFRRT